MCPLQPSRYSFSQPTHLAFCILIVFGAHLSPPSLAQVLPGEGERHKLKEACPAELAGEGAGYK